MEFRPPFPLCRSNLPASRGRHSAPPAGSGRRVCRQSPQHGNRFFQLSQFLPGAGSFASQRFQRVSHFDGRHAVSGSFLNEFGLESLPGQVGFYTSAIVRINCCGSQGTRLPGSETPPAYRGRLTARVVDTHRRRVRNALELPFCQF